MPFYKHKLKAGHAGKGHYNILVVYNYAQSLTDAIRDARHFPMVKHNAASAVLESKPVQEIDFVVGIIQNAYARLNFANEIIPLEKMSKILSRVEDYEFQTEEGKTLIGFERTYTNAAVKVKPMVEAEYIQWAEDLVAEYSDNQAFGL